ncbi:MAG: type II toxin-antitoxin system HicB family antitoxin [Trueperaceae bacterium]
MAGKSDPMSLEEYLKLSYPVTIYPEPEGGFTVEIRDLPGCVAQGETVAEALETIEEARRLWLEVAFDHGDDIPRPLIDEGFGGRVLLRMPRSLHRRLVDGAEREGVSLNQHLVSLLSEANAVNTLKKEIRELEVRLTRLNVPA